MIPPIEKEIILKDILFPDEQIEIIPVKKRKTKKQKQKIIIVNSIDKKKTRRKLPKNIEIDNNV